MDFKELLSCKNLDAFTKSIKIILPYKGYSGSYFFLCENSGAEFLVKLSFFNKSSPEIYGASQETERNTLAANEIKVLALLKNKIIDANISPCILELLYSRECSSIELSPDSEECLRLVTSPPKDNPSKLRAIFCNHKYAVESGLAYPKFAFLLMEKCDLTLHEYLSRKDMDPEIFRVILFQVIYTMYRIKKIYPKFIHGDLHSDNVLIKIDKKYNGGPAFWKTYVENVSNYVPYFGLTCKIIDCEYVSIPEEGIESHITADKHYQHSRSENDVLFLLFDIYNFMLTRDITQSSGVSNMITECKLIMDCLDPTKSYEHHHVVWIRENVARLPSYLDMLNSSCFAAYRQIDPDESQIIHEYAR